jgi:hypothetical protein
MWWLLAPQVKDHDDAVAFGLLFLFSPVAFVYALPAFLIAATVMGAGRLLWYLSPSGVAERESESKCVSGVASGTTNPHDRLRNLAIDGIPYLTYDHGASQAMSRKTGNGSGKENIELEPEDKT